MLVFRDKMYPYNITNYYCFTYSFYDKQQIFIAHNSRSNTPIDKTGEATWENTPHSPSSSHAPPPPPDYPYSSSSPSPSPSLHNSTLSNPPPATVDITQDSATIPSPLSISTESQRSSSDFHGVRYCYIPMGNKTIALHYVIKNYVTTPLVMIIDDDVMVPHNIDMEGAYNKMQDDNVKAIAFTIRGIDDANISF